MRAGFPGGDFLTVLQNEWVAGWSRARGAGGAGGGAGRPERPPQTGEARKWRSVAIWADGRSGPRS